VNDPEQGLFNFTSMQELIKVTTNTQGNRVVSARELYAYLGYENSQFSRWAKSKIVENGFSIENEDWVGFDIVVEGNKIKDYAVSLDFAKRLSMMAKTEKGEEVRNYFIECEKQLAAPKELTIKEWALLVVKAEEEKEQLALQVENLSTALDSLVEWISILKVSQFNKVSEKNFDWHILKGKSNQMGYAIKKAESPRYGYQNLYHISVFKACYPQYNYNFK
jgi:phage anti-repressor protein